MNVNGYEFRYNKMQYFEFHVADGADHMKNFLGQKNNNKTKRNVNWGWRVEGGGGAQKVASNFRTKQSVQKLLYSFNLY